MNTFHIFRPKCELELAQRHAVFCKREHPTCKEFALKKSLAGLGLALGIGTAGDFLGQQTCMGQVGHVIPLLSLCWSPELSA